MKRKRKRCRQMLLWSLIWLLTFHPGGITAQGLDSAEQNIFRQEELDQMLAPLALYPDELLAQILMAATYPLEVVQASRWIQGNPNLRGDPLAAALEQQDWDPSVKSLVNFPSVLEMMDDRLDWTQRLGDVFLAQPDQVMDTVQRLRHRAQARGNLRTTNEQTVLVEPSDQTILIEPTAPQVIYVPVYDPSLVYGPWWWPDYPPYPYYPHGAFIRDRGFGAAVGLAWGYAWGGFDWHRHRLLIDITRHRHINGRIDRTRYGSHVTTGGGGQERWRHDPDHRRGVAYRSSAIAQQFGRRPISGADGRHEFRGFDHQGTGRIGAPGSIPAAPPTPRPPARPYQTKAEPSRNPSSPMPPPRVTAGSVENRPEVRRKPAASVPPTGITAVSPQTKPEPPRPTNAPGHQRVQGLQGPTAFTGSSPGPHTREFSNRGRESLNSAIPPRSQGPDHNRASPGGGDPGGDRTHGNRQGR
jgi:hypothetical protein